MTPTPLASGDQAPEPLRRPGVRDLVLTALVLLACAGAVGIYLANPRAAEPVHETPPPHATAARRQPRRPPTTTTLSAAGEKSGEKRRKQRQKPRPRKPAKKRGDQAGQND